MLRSVPQGVDVPLGSYAIAKNSLCEHRYRLGHPLAQHALSKAKDRPLNHARLVFEYSQWPAKAVSVEPLVGKKGVLSARYLSFSGFDEQDHVLLAAVTDDGHEIDPAVIRRFFEMPCSNENDETAQAPDILQRALTCRENEVIVQLKQHQSQWFAEESQKLEKWAEDRVFAAEKELKDTKARILELKREARNTLVPEDQHRIQTQIQELEKSKRRLRQRIFEVEDDIIDQRDHMIAELEARLKQDISKRDLFTIHWMVV
jgi:hypothetical protein